MIASLCGKVKALKDDSLIIDVGGVGFQVYVASTVLSKVIPIGQAIELYTHMNVRENEIALYGFRSAEEKEFFEMLLGVSGIGPRTALAALSALSPDTLRNAIVRGDASSLSRIPGVGKKTAQRLILDLKDRIDVPAESLATLAIHEGDAEVINALTALGYSLSESQSALASIPQDVHELDERILVALRFLGR